MTVLKKNDVVRHGNIRSQVLVLACKQPEGAYGYAITKKLRTKFGHDHTHGLEVGSALKSLAEEGFLHRVDPAVTKIGQRQLYAPTAKAGFYVGLLASPID